MIRLRVSTLESFRRCVETDFGDEAALVETLRRGQWVDGPANWMMEAGTAWHDCLARPIATANIAFANGQPVKLHASGAYCFTGGHVGEALRHVGPGLCEVTGQRLVRCAGREVLIEGTADHVHGLHLQDHKAKFSTCDPRDYEPSLQWRFYLAIHGAASLRYNLFDFKQHDPDGFCALRNIVSFRFWRYPGLEADCCAWVGRFLDWCDGSGLLPLLSGGREAA